MRKLKTIKKINNAVAKELTTEEISTIVERWSDNCTVADAWDAIVDWIVEQYNLLQISNPSRHQVLNNINPAYSSYLKGLIINRVLY